jgi:hypothetical protein
MRGELNATAPPREQRIAEIFAELAGLSGNDEDEATLLPVLVDRCVEILGVAAAGVSLIAADGEWGPAVGTANCSDRRPPAQVVADGQVMPMRARGEVIGVLTLVGDGSGRFDATARELGQALADAAASAILNRRELRRSETLAGQLQHALSSRVLIEQAKGILAERWQVSVAEAFRLLREHARAHNLPLRELAREITEEGAQLPAPDTHRSPT